MNGGAVFFQWIKVITLSKGVQLKKNQIYTYFHIFILYMRNRYSKRALSTFSIISIVVWVIERNSGVMLNWTKQVLNIFSSYTGGSEENRVITLFSLEQSEKQNW